MTRIAVRVRLSTQITLSHRRACAPTVGLDKWVKVSLPLPIRGQQNGQDRSRTDDSPLIRRALCRLFEVEDDYDICAEATNGQDAIDLALKHRPDLIILDMSMPILNGMQAARELKKIMPDVPIILFTQYEYMSSVILNSDHAVDRVVSKGDADTLIEQVRSLAPA